MRIACIMGGGGGGGGGGGLSPCQTFNPTFLESLSDSVNKMLITFTNSLDLIRPDKSKA